MTSASDDDSLHERARRDRPAAYAVAVFAVALATAIRVALSPVLPDTVTLITFYPAVMISAWYGGLLPGVVATVLSTLTAAYVWLPPVASTAIRNRDDFLALAVFVAVGLVISSLNESLHRVNARQVAARRALERALQGESRAKRDAERANELKDQFLAVVSHEVRTPLNSILGWSQMLLNGALRDASARQRAVNAIHENAHRQHALIEDLLDVARIASGTMRLRRAEVDFVAVVRSAIDIVEPAAVAKRIRLTTELAVDSAPVTGDVVRLQQIVSNLLVNAVKFTPDEGTVTIGVSCDSHGAVEVRVRDTGPGVPEAFLPFVFEPFRQANNEIHSRGGLGLGMTIVRQLVTAHGGSIDVDGGGNGRGATFTVRLPLADTETRQLGVAPS